MNERPKILALVAVVCCMFLGCMVLGLADPSAAATSGGDPVGELLAAGGQALAAGDLEAAAELFGEARTLAPEHPLAWLGLAQVAERRGEVVTALENARHAESLATREMAVVLTVGRLLARLGAVSEALESFARAREIDPENAPAHLLPAVLLRTVERHGEAVELLEGAWTSGLRAPRLAEELGLLLLAVGRPADAREVASAVIGEHPDRGGLEVVLGLALAADPERRREARAHLERALELGVEAPGKVHLELAAILTEAGETAAALEHLKAARRALPDVPEVHYRLATALRASGNLDGARVALERYRELSQRSDSEDWAAKELGTKLNEIQNLAASNRLDAALERIETLAAEHSDDPRVRALEGKILFSVGRRDEGLAAVVAAREAAPERVEYHYLEGLFLVHLERPDEAAKALRRALALDADLEEAKKLLERIGEGTKE